MKESFRVLKPGGYVYITTYLSGFDTERARKIYAVLELLRNPRLFRFITKVKGVSSKISQYNKEKVIHYPTEEELRITHKESGFIKFQNISDILWKSGIITKAQKPLENI